MGFENGEFLEVEFSIWRSVDNELLSTTDEAKAKEAGIYESEARYGASLVVLGSGDMLPNVEKELKAMKEGDVKRFTLKPEEAFGNRNEDLIRVMPLSEFKKHDLNPHPGMQINLDGVRAVVKSVNSGRVVVDANPPEAGNSITYEIKIVKSITTDEGKIGSILKTHRISYNKVSMSKDSAELEIGHNAVNNPNYYARLSGTVSDILKYINSVSNVRVIEEYKRDESRKGENAGQGHSHAAPA